MPRVPHPWWKSTHRAYYAKVAGQLVRLGTTKSQAWAAFAALSPEHADEAARRRFFDPFSNLKSSGEARMSTANTKRNAAPYSIARAIAALAFRGSSLAPIEGPEGEVSRGIAERTGRGPRGLHVPDDVFAPLEKRALTSATGAGAVGTITPGSSLVDALRPKSVLGSLGARFTDLRPDGAGKLAIPRAASATTGSWVAEGSAPGSPANATYDSIVLAPHTITATTAVSRRLLKSAFADPRFDAVIADEIARSIAVEIDRVAIAGPGTGGMPTGVLATSGVNVEEIGDDGGAPTRALLLAMEKAVGLANGDAGADARLGWATSPAGRKALRSVDSASGAGRYLWDDSNRILGSPAVASSNVPSDLTKGEGEALTALIHGDWNQLLVNAFSGADVLVDPYRQSSDGYVYVNVFVDVDVALLNAAAFAVCADVATS